MVYKLRLLGLGGGGVDNTDNTPKRNTNINWLIEQWHFNILQNTKVLDSYTIAFPTNSVCIRRESGERRQVH